MEKEMKMFGKTVSAGLFSALVIAGSLVSVAALVFFMLTVPLGGIEVLANFYEIEVYVDETLAVPVELIAWTPTQILGGQSVESDVLVLSLTPDAINEIGAEMVWVRYSVEGLPESWTLEVLKDGSPWPQIDKTVLSGANNFREVQFILTPKLGETPGFYDGFSIVFSSSDE